MCAAIAAAGVGHALAVGSVSDELQFHHLHLRVDDPASHMNEAAARLDATRTILEGHGVGVRKDGQYLVFDRARFDDAIVVRVGTTDAAGLYREAADWLRDRGTTVQPSELSASHVAAAIPASPIVAVAFSAPDLSATVDRLRGRGTQPLERTGETVRYRLPSGALLEIVAETDKPDDHWCPMHPDVRSAGPSRCVRCGMDLVPIPPPRLGEYRLDVTMEPGSKGGVTGLRMVVRDPESGEIVTGLLEVHERSFHLFIIGRDLKHFLHVHPVLDGGALVLKQDLAPGQYVLIADFLPAAGTPQMVQRVIVTPGFTGPLFAAAPDLMATALEDTADGIRVRLDPGSPAPLRPTELRFELTDAKTGRPVSDLEPYLGAAGHLLIASADLSRVVHGHPEGAQSTGPILAFDPVLPAPGPYKLWVQFQRHGRVTTVPFVIVVPPW